MLVIESRPSNTHLSPGQHAHKYLHIHVTEGRAPASSCSKRRSPPPFMSDGSPPSRLLFFFFFFLVVSYAHACLYSPLTFDDVRPSCLAGGSFAETYEWMREFSERNLSSTLNKLSLRCQVFHINWLLAYFHLFALLPHMLP